MTAVEIQLPPKMVDLFDGEADVRACYGGRGSSKTRTFAKMSAIRGLMWSQAGREGVILCGRQFMNTLDDSSLEEVKAAIQSEPWLLEHYEIGEKFIRTKDGRVSYKFTGLERNINSVKSKARILLCWVDEAEPVTEQAWQVLIPTLREEDSELWVTWNPARKNSATHKRFRENTNDRMKVVELNWRDNPWFPAILDRKRQQDKIERPDSYDHIWEGDFISVVEGAYYASHITEARLEGRIGVVAKDPTIQYKAFWDIGVRDACSIWIAQFVGREIRVLDHYEAVGQPLSAHLEWMRSKKYGGALCVLPHDGAHMDAVTAIRFEDHISAAGFETETIPNQGKGAAMKRIEAARRLFPRIWFNAETCQAGVDALGWYHEKRDEERGIGLGPEHDWASHSADSFGLMCVAYDEPYVQPTRSRYAGRGNSSGGWMGA